jgi:hypothetical protein
MSVCKNLFPASPKCQSVAPSSVSHFKKPRCHSIFGGTVNKISRKSIRRESTGIQFFKKLKNAYGDPSTETRINLVRKTAINNPGKRHGFNSNSCPFPK